MQEIQLLNRVERFRQERDAGRQIYLLLEPIEWELMLIYDEKHEAYRRAHQIRIEKAFEMFLALVTRS